MRSIKANVQLSIILYRFVMFVPVHSGRGRGSYRNRGRGNYYRQPSNLPQQPPSIAPQSHTNVPYFDPTMNLMNASSGTYRDNPYQDIQQNRYDTIPPFAKNRNERLVSFIIENSMASTLISTLQKSNAQTILIAYSTYIRNSYCSAFHLFISLSIVVRQAMSVIRWNFIYLLLYTKYIT